MPIFKNLMQYFKKSRKTLNIMSKSKILQKQIIEKGVKILIFRHTEQEKQTLGYGFVVDKNSNPVFFFSTLELPYSGNRASISSIPIGIYKGIKSNSPSLGNVIKINGVLDRTHILIHQGNYNNQIRGCILVGTSFVDINKDGVIDLFNSKITLNNLLKHLPIAFNIEIN